MKKDFRLRFYRYMLVISAAIVVNCFCFASSYMAMALSKKPDEHIINLHENGREIGFVTKAKTLREALKNENIRIDENDHIEPSLDEKLVASSYQVNIYRARPVLIKDGLVETRILTPYRTAKQIAKHAGIVLHDADEAKLVLSQDLLADGATEIMEIKRATQFVFDFYGKSNVDYTMARTVGDMLKKKNIKMTKDDGIEPSLDTPIVAGMKIRLWRNGVQSITVEEDVDFPIKKIKDADRSKGFREVKTSGEKGRRTVTYEINVENGIEVSRKEINSNVTKQPVEQVEVVGTKVSLPAGSHEDWMAAAGIASSDHGYANFIISRESGWRHSAINPSGAYGLCQALPGGKMSSAGADWETNPITQLKWCNGYAISRYGSWSNAYNFWVDHHWW